MVKSFIWQACNNILPTKKMLCKRKIIKDPFCSICVLATETVGHILYSFPSAKDVRIECPPKIIKCTSVEADFIDIMAHSMEHLNENQLQAMAAVA